MSAPGPAALLLAPTLLAGVLALSGVAKLRDTDSTRSVLMLLRLPGPLTRRWVAVALPWGELALAVALLAVPGGAAYVVVAGLTVALFAAYWAVVARALGFDPRPTCGCFGRIGDQRITSRTLVRNTVLLALAAVTLGWSVAGGAVPGALATAGAEGWAWLVGAVVVALVVVLVGPTLSSPRPAELPEHPADPTDDDYVRQSFPDVLLYDGGAALDLYDLTRTGPLLLVADAAGDAPLGVWRDLLPEVDVRRSLPTSSLGQTPGEAALLDPRGRVAAALGCLGEPCAVLLGTDGLTAGGPAVGEPAIGELVGDIRVELDAATRI